MTTENDDTLLQLAQALELALANQLELASELRRHGAPPAVARPVEAAGAAGLANELDLLELERVSAALLVRLTEEREALAVHRMLSNIAGSYGFAEGLDAETAGDRFCAIHAHDNFALWPGYRLARRDGTPLIADVVESTVMSDRPGPALAQLPVEARRYIEFLDDRVIRRADALYTVSDSLATYLAERHGRPFGVLRNARPFAPQERDRSPLEELGIPGDAPVVCYANMIRLDMGVLEALEALTLLPADVQLLLAGAFADADTEAMVRSRVEGLGVEDRVHVAPQRPHPEFIRLLSGADVGLNPVKGHSVNLEVSLPNRVFDYVAARLPFVTSEVGDAAELVRKHELGAVVDDVSAAAIAAAVAPLLDPAVAAGTRKAMAQAARDLSWENEVAGYLTRVEELHAAGDAPRSVAIVARKRIDYNVRLHQLAGALAAADFDVHIFSLTPFVPGMQATLPPRVRQTTIPLREG